MGQTSRPARAFALVLLATLVHLCALWAGNRPTTPPDAPPGFPSLSFSPHARGSSPEDGGTVDEERVRRAMAAAATVTRRVRTYTVSEGLDVVPRVADEMGMTVTLGIYVDATEERTRREIERAVELARLHPSVVEIIVGNESILAETRKAAELLPLMREVRERTGLPVSTAEPWHIWLDHPELAEAADFVAVHVLPFWVGVGAPDSLATARQNFAETVEAFPGKRILVAEFGWPSGRGNRFENRASPAAQALAVREFSIWAAREGVEWNLIEAFDQPWKVSEGPVGAYWGFFDVDMRPKFALSGPIEADRAWIGRAALGPALGVLLALATLLLVPPKRMVTFALVAAAAQVVGWAAADAALWPVGSYLTIAEAVAWAIGLPMLALVGALAFERVREATEVAFDPRPMSPQPGGGANPLPRVSIHVPACREDPGVVIRTLESLARLDHPDFEVVLVVNNTTDRDRVEPLRLACERLGKRFRFLDFPVLAGFKSGALNRALEATDPRATVIGVVDADYEVEPGWLRDALPAFDDPRVAISQAPQEHRDEGGSWLRKAINSEYSGFFDVGMIQRARDDAIVVHGTMLLVRRAALDEVGGWDEAHICEDTHLGLTLLERGWSARYASQRQGAGLLPDDLVSFRSQRWRWAYGGMRIMVAHLPGMLRGRSSLTRAQRWHFLAGWLHWIGDAIAVFASVVCAFWAFWISLTGTGELPPPAVTTAIVAALAVSTLHSVLTYGLRVRGGWRRAFPAIVAAMSLQTTVAHAVATGLVAPGRSFRVTAKGGKRRVGFARAARSVAPDAALAAFILTAALALGLSARSGLASATLLQVVLVAQALPCLAALALAAIEMRGQRRRPPAEKVAPSTEVASLAA